MANEGRGQVQASLEKDREFIFIAKKQCFGSGRIRIIGTDPDPLQETLIWIRVPKKKS